MKILQASYQDLAGIGQRVREAINRYTPHECRAIRVEETYLQYPHDMTADFETAEGQALWANWIEWADIVHIHEYRDLWGLVQHFAPGKPVVWHLHGTYYRQMHEELNALFKAHHIRTVASTVDLLTFRHASQWLPVPLDIEKLLEYRVEQDGMHAAMSRTNPEKGDLPDVEGVTNHLIQGQANEVALTLKGGCDMAFDQFTLGLGVSGLESMAMGIPTMSGGPDWLLRLMRTQWGELPFMPVTNEAELRASMECLRDSPGLRTFWADRGRNHIVKWHHAPYVAEMITHIYEEVLD